MPHTLSSPKPVFSFFLHPSNSFFYFFLLFFF
uniref:Uncharacterized protein n=1 Tax=Nelumbo nucifera TaxID=4432 RepID=A0A822YVK5_NELNU|nr:TPA_asm: hypothetical protein HUJ06_006059 [Nelumbo nucifera]